MDSSYTSDSSYSSDAAISTSFEIWAYFQDKYTLTKLLLRENDLRSSPIWQSKYLTSHSSDTHDWLDITAKLQHDLIRYELISRFPSCHVTTIQIHNLLQLYRNAIYTFPELRSIPLHVRYNRVSETEEQHLQLHRLHKPIPSNLHVHVYNRLFPHSITPPTSLSRLLESPFDPFVSMAKATVLIASSIT